jgi:hypothetical protein
MSQQQGSISVVGLITSSVAVVGIGALLMRPAPVRTAEFDAQSISSVEKQLKIEIAKEKSGKHAKPNYFHALKSRLLLQSYPFDRPDVSAMDNALEHSKLMPRADINQFRQAGAAGASEATVGRSGMFRAVPITPPATWENIGPKNLEVPYNIYYGPPKASLGGRVGGIAYDPFDANIMYIGAPGGGIWKTVDGGINWVSKGDEFTSPYVGKIGVSPHDNNLVIAGLGDRDGGLSSGNGILRSEDGGETWTNISLRGGTTASEVVFDPEDPNLVFVAMQDGGGLFRSTDRGQTFSPVTIGGSSFPTVSDLAYGAPDENGDFQYIVRAVGRGMFVSNDDGLTWNPVSEPGSNGVDRNHFDASHVNFGRLYYSDSNTETIYQGDWDGSDYVWTDITGNLPNDGYNWSQSWYDHHLTVANHLVDGQPQDFVYVGLITIAVWDGQKWNNIGQTYENTAKTHNDQHCMAISPSDPNKVVIGNDGGVWPITYDDNKKTWEIMKVASRTLPLAMFYSAAWHPRDEFTMMGGTQDNASPVSMHNIANWVNRTGGDGGGCAINPNNPKVAYGSSQFLGLYRTTNGWISQTDFGPPDDFRGDRFPFITRMSIDPTFPNPLYVHTNYLNRYNANGSWNRRLGNTNLAPSGGTILSSSVAPSNPDVIYTGSETGNLFRSADRGATWRRLDTVASLAWTARPITSISVNPNNPNDILVSLAGGTSAMGRVVRIADASLTNPVRSNASGSGVSALPNISANSITRDDLDPINKLYVGTDVGIFGTTNGGASWQNMTQALGLPVCEVKEVKWVPGTGYLNIATYGRGMWRLKLLDISEDKKTQLFFYPNIFRTGGVADIVVTVENQGPLLVENLKITDSTLTLSTGPTTRRTKLPIYIGAVNYSNSNGFAISYGVRNRLGANGSYSFSGSYQLQGRTINFTETRTIRGL